MQRDDSQATKAAEQQTINSLQVSLVLLVVVKGECATFNAHTSFLEHVSEQGHIMRISCAPFVECNRCRWPVIWAAGLEYLL